MAFYVRLPRKLDEWSFILALICVSILSYVPGCEGTDSDLASYQQAMMPAAQDEVEALGPIPYYHIEANIDTEELFLAGRQRLEYTNLEGMELREIYFRLYPNLPAYEGKTRIHKAAVNGQEALFSYEAQDTALKLVLGSPLPPGEALEIELGFTVEIPRQDKGYVLFGYSQGILSLPSFYPMLAVHDEDYDRNGGWHLEIAPAHADAVYSEAALYQVDVTVPTEMVVVTSGSVLEVEHIAEGRRTLHCVSGPARDFALLMSQDFQVQSSVAQGTTVNSYYLPQDERAGRSALWYTAAALKVYNDCFGPYPYRELDVVEAPLAYRGMEYPGLSLIGVALYRKWREELEFLIAHEVGHQWWYNQVGSDPLNHPWLDEGLTEYSTIYYYQMVHGRAEAEELLRTRWLIPYESAVRRGRDAVVAQPAAAFAGNYELIVYAKGALFFNALRQTVGDDVYLAIMRRYLREYKYRRASPQDFMNVAQKVSGLSLDEVYRQWLGE